MARFLVWSDLHDEAWHGFELPEVLSGIDGVLIAGDTHTKGRHLEIPAMAARKYDCPVVLIWGNHEPYGAVWPDLLRDEDRQLAELKAEGLDIRVLHGAATEIADVRVIGATLWTDLQLYPALENLARERVSDLMPDYRAIFYRPNTLFSLEDMLNCHSRDKAAIFAALSTPFDGQTVVMTHHLPVRQLIAPWRLIGGDAKRAANNGFACDLWQRIQKFDINTWICGHSHDPGEWVGNGNKGPIRFVMNQRGYPAEELEFDPAFILEV